MKMTGSVPADFRLWHPNEKMAMGAKWTIMRWGNMDRYAPPSPTAEGPALKEATLCEIARPTCRYFTSFYF